MNKFKIEVLILLTLMFIVSCKHHDKQSTNSSLVNHKTVDTLYYKNLNTNQIIKDADMGSFIGSLIKEYTDSILGTPNVNIRINKTTEKKDSVIRFFTYDIRVGLEYPVRSRDYPKIGVTIPSTKFETIYGDSVQIGGIQDKPSVISLWFIGCRGCVDEIPALNRLHEKLSDKVNFVALTFDDKKDVKSFLNKTPYNFIHVASKDWEDKKKSIDPFIKTIGSYPYPENIFVDRFGKIKYVEGGLGSSKDLDMAIKHFELIIQDLLNEKPNH